MNRSMRKLKRIARSCVGISLLCCAVIAHAQSTDGANTLPTASSMTDGETIYHRICQGCHMPDARGAVGAGTYPALIGNPRLVSAPYMAAVILNGRRDMPSFGTREKVLQPGEVKLSDEQIASVINFVRTHFGNRYTDSITPAEVIAMHH
jgi:mono/diheme cytochrome c family protein